MDGIIIINKEKGYTSHDVVAKVKRILNQKKVGHTGTLDPNATGVLPLLLGNGTKLSKYLIEHDKKYEVLLQLGTKTDTADGEGKIIQEKEVNIENLEERLLNAVKQNIRKTRANSTNVFSNKSKWKKIIRICKRWQTSRSKAKTN